MHRKAFYVRQSNGRSGSQSIIRAGRIESDVDAIRNIEKALGSSEKRSSPSESVNIDVVRKSIFAKIAIKKGEVLSENNLSIKRPGNGISPMKWDEVAGTIATKEYQEDELI